MEGARGDEQDVVGLDHAVLGANRGSFDQGQQIALHTFSGHIRASAFRAFGDLVQLVNEYDAVLFCRVTAFCFNSSSFTILVASSSQSASKAAFTGILRFCSAAVTMLENMLCSWLVISSMPGGAMISMAGMVGS